MTKIPPERIKPEKINPETGGAKDGNLYANPQTTPFELPAGHELLHSFPPSRQTYIREHIMLAAIGAVVLSGGLMAAGNPHAWTGIIGSVLAIGARGAYAMSEQLAMTWRITDKALIGPDMRQITHANIANARTFLSAMQVITTSGDKYLIKYQPDPAASAAQILRAIGKQSGKK